MFFSKNETYQDFDMLRSQNVFLLGGLHNIINRSMHKYYEINNADMLDYYTHVNATDEFGNELITPVSMAVEYLPDKALDTD